MLKKLRFISSLLIVFSLNIEAKSLLYKVSSESANVYILGSIHLAKPELYPLAKEITQAYENSDVLVLELDPTSRESTKSIQEAMLTKGMYLGNKSLKSELSDATYKELDIYMQKTGMPLEPMQKMRPWVVVLQLSVVEMMRLGYSPELGIDQHFLKMAQQESKPIIELETAAEQMALLSKEDVSFQDKLLFYTLKDMKEIEPMLNEIFSGWKNGDAKRINKIMSLSINDDSSLKEMYDDLITKRNYKMSKAVERFLKTKKDYFVVVGSGHVVGEEGIVSLLKKAGYKVVQQ